MRTGRPAPRGGGHELQGDQAAILEIEKDDNQRRLLEVINIYKNKIQTEKPIFSHSTCNAKYVSFN